MEGTSRIVSIVATKPHEAVVFLLHFLADVRNVCVHVWRDALDDALLATLDSRGTACYKQIAPLRDGDETLSHMAGESECVFLFEDGMTSESLSTLRRAYSRVITGRRDDVQCTPRDVAAEMLRQWADSDTRVQAVYEYWFRARDETGAPVFNGKMWLKQASALDEEIREKFSSLHEEATSGSLDHWMFGSMAAVAWVVVVDQFSRHLFRDSPQMYAYDALASQMLDCWLRRGIDTVHALSVAERDMFFRPWMHSEQCDHQRRSVDAYRILARECPEQCAGAAATAEGYLEIVSAFGRFPHRNRILSRAFTTEERLWHLCGGRAKSCALWCSAIQHPHIRSLAVSLLDHIDHSPLHEIMNAAKMLALSVIEHRYSCEVSYAVMRFACSGVGLEEWEKSAESYDVWLHKHGTCIHQRLATDVAKQCRGMQTRDKLNIVIDICTGTGLVLEKIADHLDPSKPARLVGVDTNGMLRVVKGKRFHPHRISTREMKGAWSHEFEGKADVITCNMSIFQFAPDVRHIVLQDVARALRPGGMFIVTTFHGASKAGEGRQGFRSRLFEVLGRELETKPQEMVDSTESLRLLCQPHGLEPHSSLLDDQRSLLEQCQAVATATHERPLGERVDFMRVPVIGSKALGFELSDSDVETILTKMHGHTDTASGTTYVFKKEGMASSEPLLQFANTRYMRRPEMFVYTASATIRTPSGRVVMCLRGRNTKDFSGVWSLPSTTVKTDIVRDIQFSVRNSTGLDITVTAFNAIRIADRENHVMCMVNVDATTTEESATPASSKYERIEMWDEEKVCNHDAFFVESEGRIMMGDCVKAFQLTRAKQEAR